MEIISPQSHEVHIVMIPMLFYLFIFWLHLAACGILVPRPGMEPLLWKCRVLTTGPLGKSLIPILEMAKLSTEKLNDLLKCIHQVGGGVGVHRAAVTTLSSLRGELVPETDEGIHIHVRLAICGGKWKPGHLLDVQLGRKQHEENEADQPRTHVDSGKTAVGVPSEECLQERGS